MNLGVALLAGRLPSPRPLPPSSRGRSRAAKSNPTSQPSAGCPYDSRGRRCHRRRVHAFGFALSRRHRIYAVTGELFPTTRLGIRLGYTYFDEERFVDDRSEIAVTWFFKRSIAAELALAQTDLGISSGIDQDEVLIRLIGRL